MKKGGSIKVNIRFLRQGSIEVDAPDNIKKMTAQEIKIWAEKIIEEQSDEELLRALADFRYPKIDGYFDSPPQCSAVEDSAGVNIMTTEEWQMFCYGTGNDPFIPRKYT
jgi:hypothetical protein